MGIIENEVIKLEEYHLLQECRDVYLDEVPGPPPKRDIDFTIYLFPRVVPMSKIPYRMNTLELLEWKMQLQELFENKHIHLSVSPWG